MRANFLIAGTQKGGTTALAHFLSQHPQVCMPSEKELHFFDNDKRYFARDGTPNYDAYHRSFANCANARAIGEATPIYMFLPEVPERLHAYNAELKLILILRDPRQRAYSHYAMELGRKAETLSFSKAIRQEDSRLGGDYLRDVNSGFRVHSYVRRGFYAMQIMRLKKFFPMSQLLVLKNESLSLDHDETMLRTYDFLGLDHVTPPETTRVFQQSYEPMLAEDYAYLTDIFRPDIESLERLLDWNLEDWKT